MRSRLAEIALPTFGYKAHTSIDQRFRRFAAGTSPTLAATMAGSCAKASSTPRTPGPACGPIQPLGAERDLAAAPRLHQPPTAPARPLLAHICRGNGRRSRHGAPVEHVFAVQKQAMGLMVHPIELARARTRIGLADPAYNLRRLVQLQGRVAA